MGARGSLESGSGFGAKPWNTVGTWEEKIAQEALFINFSHCGNTPEAGAFIKSRFGLVWFGCGVQGEQGDSTRPGLADRSSVTGS